MFATIAEWWTRLKNWTVASTVGAKRETVESFLETTQARDIAQAWDDYILTYHRFPQILRGGERPQDRPDQEGFNHNFPGWVDFEVNEWEGPEGIGWNVKVFVTEKGKDWVLTLERPWTDPKWEEVLDEPV